MQVPLQLPKILSWSISRQEERRRRQLQAKETKQKQLQMAWEVNVTAFMIIRATSYTLYLWLKDSHAVLLQESSPYKE